MAIPAQQIGWSQKAKLLWNISKQLEILTQVAGNVVISPVPSPTTTTTTTAAAPVIITANISSIQSLACNGTGVNFSLILSGTTLCDSTYIYSDPAGAFAGFSDMYVAEGAPVIGGQVRYYTYVDDSIAVSSTPCDSCFTTTTTTTTPPTVYMFVLSQTGDDVSACSATPNTTLYSLSGTLTDGSFMYFDLELTVPAGDFWWYSDGTTAFFVSGGAGQITSSSICALGNFILTETSNPIITESGNNIITQ